MTESFNYGGKELEIFSSAKNWKKYIAASIKPYIKGRVLEAGAGLGSMTSWLNEGQFEWVLLEPDRKMATLLKEKINTGLLPGNCSVIDGFINDAGSLLFDTIIYIDVLEHIDDDREEMARACSLLNTGGKLVVLSPAFQFLYSPFDASIGHFRRYSKKSLEKIAGEKLTTISIRYMDTAGFFSSLANKLILQQAYPTQKQIIFWDRFLVPVSIFLDKLFFYSFGKSIVGIWEK